jgi:hypothetical protein
VKIQRSGASVKVWGSSSDTYDWAHRPGRRWPCSQLSGRRVFAELYQGDLVELSLDGEDGDVDANELNAFLEDALGSR